MGFMSMPRLAVSLWFLNYSLLALITYMSSGAGRLSIFWTIVQATVWMAIELMFIGFWDDSSKATGK